MAIHTYKVEPTQRGGTETTIYKVNAVPEFIPAVHAEVQFPRDNRTWIVTRVIPLDTGVNFDIFVVQKGSKSEPLNLTHMDRGL
jgi:hypothetical protein